MERLTMSIGNSFYYSDNGNPILPVEILDTPKVREILERLSEYEDTKLTPVEIKNLEEQYRLLESGNKQLLEELRYSVQIETHRGMKKEEVLSEIDNKLENLKKRIESRKTENWYWDETKRIEQFERQIEELETAKEYISKIG